MWLHDDKSHALAIAMAETRLQPNRNCCTKLVFGPSSKWTTIQIKMFIDNDIAFETLSNLCINRPRATRGKFHRLLSERTNERMGC